ncbi:SpoIIE family protein phosphatase [Limibacter armeniacum]|uniref:PP2C family protein-serine/threonine phosphatase n=1 Tax=Limibacter armeniacum TaxID=466084 RepID=UPI002FE6A78D
MASVIYKGYTSSFSFYFSVFDIIVLGTIFLMSSKEKPNKKLNYLFVGYLTCSVCIQFMLNNGHKGVVPYVQLMIALLFAAIVRWKTFLPWMVFFYVVTFSLHLISHMKEEWIVFHSDITTFWVWRVTVYMMAMLIIIVVVAILRYNHQVAYKSSVYKRLKLEKQRELLEVQKVQIDQSLAAITESIRYAERIQNTLLPDQRETQSLLPESFIFYQPKDIVSGDFYWMAQQGSAKVVVVADCTGHGIPGAFMSVLGYVFLDQVVNVDKILSPAEMLSIVHERVNQTLSHKGRELTTHDGMDMAICVIDTSTSTLTFSGARLSLHYVQDGKNQIIRGVKKSIGDVYREDLEFENHTISLEKPTTCFLFTDGFQDQFGGPLKKKYLSKNLKTLLYNNAELPMDLQKSNIEKAFLNWKGEEQQVDDVLVVGFRISS